jgi:hypothetical protein
MGQTLCFCISFLKYYSCPSLIRSCVLDLQPNQLEMNTQEIIKPIGKLIEWIFVNVYEHIADPFNAGVLILSLVSLVIWLKVLNGYVSKAKAEGKTP